MKTSTWYQSDTAGNVSRWDVTLGRTPKEIVADLIDDGAVVWRLNGKPDRRYRNGRIVANLMPGITKNNIG